MKRDHFKTKKSYSFTMIFQSQQVFILYSLFLALKFHHHLFRNLTNIQIPNRQHPGDSIATNPRKGSPELPGQLLWSRNSEGIFPPESRILPSRSLGREQAVDKTSVRCPGPQSMARPNYKKIQIKFMDVPIVDPFRTTVATNPSNFAMWKVQAWPLNSKVTYWMFPFLPVWKRWIHTAKFQKITRNHWSWKISKTSTHLKPICLEHEMLYKDFFWMTLD